MLPQRLTAILGLRARLDYDENAFETATSNFSEKVRDGRCSEVRATAGTVTPGQSLHRTMVRRGHSTRIHGCLDRHRLQSPAAIKVEER